MLAMHSHPHSECITGNTLNILKTCGERGRQNSASAMICNRFAFVMLSQCFSYTFVSFPYGVPMFCLCLSYAFPMLSLCFPNAFPMLLLYFPWAFPMLFLYIYFACFSYAFGICFFYPFRGARRDCSFVKLETMLWYACPMLFLPSFYTFPMLSLSFSYAFLC